MEESKRKLNFIQNLLPKLILENNDDLKNFVVVKCSANDSTKLDGFMSSMFHVEMQLEEKFTKRTETLKVVAKLMKGDNNFRDTVKSNVMCFNEIHIYKNVIPTFKNFLQDSVKTFNPDEWIPRTYYAEFKAFPELSDVEEALLVLENLQTTGYRLGPRIDLDETHLRMMIRNIAQYHSVFHAMKIKRDPRLQSLIGGMKPLPFVDSNGKVLASYNRWIEIALNRVFKIVNNDPEFQKDSEFVRILKKLQIKYGKRPAELMQKFLRFDETFCVILHGDYNRNNVLFQYDKESGHENPKSIKMIDFQETRYATCVIDLAFFMYGNMPSSLRPKLWDKLLEFYHDTLIISMSDVLKCDKNDDRLKPYSLDKFLKHFAEFAFYGTMIGIHFIPWMACSEEECRELSEQSEKDMNSDRMEHLAEVCGGQEGSERVMEVVKHSFDHGYMAFLDELD